ncbi:fibroblast growth factor receptor homolog 1 isoform X2 [Clupea harengus]|uniref:Fibroblast growth factor receptor homolog 1 isoform X2 n=1 Tax=Clupea harengus TaxID=7950 RepID=A0A6P8G1X4_CLUHA|nr:fibroblast growth factor receptor homolog 1 isoform X2 [Clupea harengus]
MTGNSTVSTPGSPVPDLDNKHYVLIAISGFTILIIIVLGVIWIKKYRTLTMTIQDLRRGRPLMSVLQAADSPPHLTTMPQLLPLPSSTEPDNPEAPLQRGKTWRNSRLPWRPLPQVPNVKKSDLNLLQLIKAGKEGVFYKAKMTRGTCKGHSAITCKISKEGVTPKQVEMEASIMRKLLYHKNVLQLLDWNSVEEPYVLIMEFVSYGTMRNFLQTQRDRLVSDPELQSLFTIASYHIALAMEHIRSKMIVHCDLALRNIMVSRFPWEVKVAEFGLARDLTRMRSRRSTHKKQRKERVPLRWYPPEYFRNSYYSFKGDVWAFGIVLWEMQTFGTLPYPNLETSEEVVYQICAGHRNNGPDSCREEIQQIMKDCWREPYTSRPSFTDIVRILENVLENDSDYVDVGSAMGSAIEA